MAAKKKAEVEQEREIRRQEQQQKRLEATRKREAQVRQGTESKSVTTTKSSPNTSSPFSFFGGNRQQQVPEVKKWKQNKDGSISGLIYNSKSFQDGTRVTTSPVPKGARKGTVVKTAAGTNYSLM
ncbi:MAG: hypothetical protein ACI8RD_010632 [Bacillariaceae sp.]|jgi:hypothetical protein